MSELIETTLSQLPKLTLFQREAVKLTVEKIGFDMFIKSALYRSIKKGDKRLVFQELNKWSTKIGDKETEKIKALWERLG